MFTALLKTWRAVVTVLVATALLAGCAGESEYERRRDKTAQELYAAARESLELENFKTAITKLEDLDSRYPFGPFSQQAQLDLLYAYYRNGDAPPATAAADRFIRQNPRHPNLDYVYYMKGLVNFSAELGAFKEVLSAPLSERDASTAKQAFDDFSEFLKRYPDSQYAADAHQRMIYLRNRLADAELHVAHYYIKRNAWMAAANRARYVVEHFPGATNTAEALAIMVRSYHELGLPVQKEEAQKVLALNYPQKADEVAKLLQ